MIHSSTSSHYQLCKYFLSENIPVFVDKPVSNSIHEIEEIYNVAKTNNILLRVGFNRRYAPLIREAHNYGKPDVISYQKNRFNLTGKIIDFVFDDFIHVIDTSRFLMQEDTVEFKMSFLTNDKGLYSINLFLLGKTVTCNSLMYRDSGITEEKIEVLLPSKKLVINDLSILNLSSNNCDERKPSNNWISTLEKRGFKTMIEEFIFDLTTSTQFLPKDEDSLITHRLCSDIYYKILGDSN